MHRRHNRPLTLALASSEGAVLLAFDSEVHGRACIP